MQNIIPKDKVHRTGIYSSSFPTGMPRVRSSIKELPLVLLLGEKLQIMVDTPPFSICEFLLLML
ncbi:hypothetical protein [Paenibacillus sp. RC253]|uniref:hypothetical protein n=1 Tax=Paenibacillus sp. RC253 TaxID=3156313 RepID=UPI00383438E5